MNKYLTQGRGLNFMRVSLVAYTSNGQARECIYSSGAFSHEVKNIMLATPALFELGRLDKFIPRCSQDIVVIIYI